MRKLFRALVPLHLDLCLHLYSSFFSQKVAIFTEVFLKKAIFCRYAQNQIAIFVDFDVTPEAILHILDIFSFFDLEAVYLHLTGRKPSAADDITVLIDTVI